MALIPPQAPASEKNISFRGNKKLCYIVVIDGGTVAQGHSTAFPDCAFQF